MAKHYRKGSNQDIILKTILLITAILNLAKAVMELITYLTG